MEKLGEFCWSHWNFRRNLHLVITKEDFFQIIEHLYMDHLTTHWSLPI